MSADCVHRPVAGDGGVPGANRLPGRRRSLPAGLAVLLLLFAAIPGVAAWTVQDVTINPEGGMVAPKAPVAVSCTIHFDLPPEGTGRTFDADHTLEMTTELNGATWTATLVNIGKGRDPITTPLASKTGSSYRIEGSTLSWDDAELNLIVTIRGTAPDVRDQDKVMISIKELDENGEPVPDAVATVTDLVAVPTTASPAQKIPVKTAATATAASRETTRAPAVAGTQGIPPVKQTYSPGPDPGMVVGLLTLAGIAAHRIRNG